MIGKMTSLPNYSLKPPLVVINGLRSVTSIKYIEQDTKIREMQIIATSLDFGLHSKVAS
jgi:hypothetical protein